MNFFRLRKYPLVRPPAGRMAELVVEEIDDELVVYDQRLHHVHALTPIAARVWRACDGHTPAGEIAAALELDKPTVTRALAELEECDLLDDGLVGLTRREVTAGAAKIGAAAVGAPLIYSIAAPTSAMALTGAVPCVTFAPNCTPPAGGCVVPSCDACSGVCIGGGTAHCCVLSSPVETPPLERIGDPVSVGAMTSERTTNAAPHQLDLSFDGKWLVTANYNARTLSMFKIDLTTGVPALIPEHGPGLPEGMFQGTSGGAPLNWAEFSPLVDGKLFVVTANAGNPGLVTVFEVNQSTGVLTPTLGDPGMPEGVPTGSVAAFGAAFSPDGRFLAVTSNNGPTRVWRFNASNGTLTDMAVAPPAANNLGRGVAWRPGGGLQFALTRSGCGTVDDRVIWIDVEGSGTGPPTLTLSAGTNPSGVLPPNTMAMPCTDTLASAWDVAFSPDGRLTAAVSAAGSVVVFDNLSTPAFARVFTDTGAGVARANGNGPRGVSFGTSACGTHLLVANLGTGSVTVYDVDTATPASPVVQGSKRTISVGATSGGCQQSPKHAVFSPNGEFVYTSNYGTIQGGSTACSEPCVAGATGFVGSSCGNTVSVFGGPCTERRRAVCVSDCHDCTDAIAASDCCDLGDFTVVPGSCTT